MLFEPYVRFHIFSSTRYVFLSHFSFFPTPRFVEWEFLSDSAIS